MPGVGLLRAALLPRVVQRTRRSDTTAPGHLHRVPWGIAATPARPRPGDRRDLRRQASCRRLCCLVVPRGLVGAASGPAGVGGRRPALQRARGGLASPHWHRGQRPGVVGWRRVLGSGSVGVSCPPWGCAAGVWLPQSGPQCVAGGSSGPGGAPRCLPRCRSPCAPRAQLPPGVGASYAQGVAGLGGGGRLLGGQGTHISPQPPNQGVQATAASVRSCLAPAARRA